ncbi:MAG: hypothetical protein JXJ04_26160 [Spirochaetales bacterium]|nr:hypothetical protein [Spirochaetales bacterium]
MKYDKASKAEKKNTTTKILLVEDDTDLVKQIKEIIDTEFKDEDIEIDIFSDVESVLNKLKEADFYFQLVILDIMLPGTEKKYQEIQDLNKILLDINKQIRKTNDRESKAELREKRQTILFDINEKINMRGGLTIASYYKELCIENKREQAPILFFTAVKEPERIEEARQYCDRFDWLGKPMLSNELLDKIKLLLGKE